MKADALRFSDPGRFTTARLTGTLQATLLRALHATWRIRCDASPLDVPLAAGRRVLLVFWHGKYVPIFSILAGRRACVFTSLSRRGAIIREICRRFGYEAVMVPDEGGETSYEAMKRALAAHCLCGIAADGPLGPAGLVKRGAVRLASDTGFEIVAASVASHPKRVLEERWDRMELPRPFARVSLAMRPPLVVPPGLDASAVDDWCNRVRQELERAGEEANRAI